MEQNSPAQPCSTTRGPPEDQPCAEHLPPLGHPCSVQVSVSHSPAQSFPAATAQILPSAAGAQSPAELQSEPMQKCITFCSSLRATALLLTCSDPGRHGHLSPPTAFCPRFLKAGATSAVSLHAAQHEGCAREAVSAAAADAACEQLVSRLTALPRAFLLRAVPALQPPAAKLIFIIILLLIQSLYSHYAFN